jgi:hypothetical protein
MSRLTVHSHALDHLSISSQFSDSTAAKVTGMMSCIFSRSLMVARRRMARRDPLFDVPIPGAAVYLSV